MKRINEEKYDEIFETAKNGCRHSGTYQQALEKTDAQLDKSIRSHEWQIAEHINKINNPHEYISDWSELSETERERNIKTWEKHADRNREESEIEKRVRKGRKQK